MKAPASESFIIGTRRRTFRFLAPLRSGEYKLSFVYFAEPQHRRRSDILAIGKPETRNMDGMAITEQVPIKVVVKLFPFSDPKKDAAPFLH